MHVKQSGIRGYFLKVGLHRRAEGRYVGSVNFIRFSPFEGLPTERNAVNLISVGMKSVIAFLKAYVLEDD